MDKWDISLLIVCLGFYLFFPFYDGPVWCVDSSSYATMNIAREPLYPTFLFIFRKLFGENAYLMPVVIAQSLLAAYATWKLSLTIKGYKDSRNLLACLSVCFQFAVTILCRFVAIRGSSYINSIMTEGLGLSLYVLFIVQLYKYIMEEKGKNLAGTACFALLLVNLRKQMLITFCLMSAVFLLYFLIKRRSMKKFLLLFGLVVCVYLTSKLTDRFYNYSVRGAWIEHAADSRGMLSTLIYTSKQEDSFLFQDESMRSLFEEIFARAEEQELRKIYAPEGWVEMSTHYADSYDAIGYGIINPVVQEYIAEKFDYSEIDTALKFDEYCNAMAKTLLAQDKSDLLQVYIANTWKGFVNSIARVHSYLNIYAVLAYTLFLSLYFYYLYKAAAGKSRKWAEPDGTLTLAEIVIGGVIVNSIVVGAMIFAQPRYMIYNMGLFYSALSVLLYDLLPSKLKK